MRKKHLISITLIILLTTSSCGILNVLKFSEMPRFLLGGIQVDEPDNEKWIKTLKDAGMNTVPVTVYAKQGDWNTDNLWYDKANIYVIDEIRTAKKNGLNVVMILRVALDHAFSENEFLWHGMIMPKSEEELESWFNKYTNFITEWARIAEQEGVDILGIGSEMNSLSATIQVEKYPSIVSYFKEISNLESQKNRVLQYSEIIENSEKWYSYWPGYDSLDEYLTAMNTKYNSWARQVGYTDLENSVDLINKRRSLLNEYWVNLIKDTRKHFKGKLLYAANFDNFHEVDFWHKLDFIGINAYFPLRDYNETKDSEDMYEILLSGWDQVFQKIEQFRRDNNLNRKKVIFTELGYTNRQNSTIEPWNSRGFSLFENSISRHLLIWQDEPVNHEERALAIKTLNETNKKFDNMLKGLLYWKFSSFKSHTEIEPFLIYIGKDSSDPAIKELRRF